MSTSRLAPSPTGALHLGNACTFLLNWALARSNRWDLFFRVEDLCGPTRKTGGKAHAIETLQWLGIFLGRRNTNSER